MEYKISISRRYESELSIIFFDIDHFKRINDNFGHDVGDTVLKELSALIKTHIRESDIFARWGGEEFVVLLPNTPLKDAVLLGEKLQKAIKSYKFTQVEKLTCSFGVTQLQAQEDANEFFKRADMLLYRAKEEGRDKIVSDIN
ncbi:MAG: GGDEF domain-containing protein [Sulfurimonas sp.]